MNNGSERFLIGQVGGARPFAISEREYPNEITDLSAWIDPAYDAAGNMTTMPAAADPWTTSFTLKYDAWNRLIEVKNGNTQIQKNEYDGLGRRIVRYDAVNDDTYDCYYNENWQLLEERKDGDADPLNKYIWHPYYVDALLLRWYDADTNGSADAHFYLQDANYNVTAITDVSGAVLERYSYSPYGDVTVWTDVFGAVTGNVTQIGNTHYYTGRERDLETRLQLNRHRFYASHLGRWLTRDPIRYNGSPYNLYEYVEGNPTKFVDSFGKQTEKCAGLCTVCCTVRDSKTGKIFQQAGAARCDMSLDYNCGGWEERGKEYEVIGAIWGPCPSTTPPPVAPPGGGGGGCPGGCQAQGSGPNLTCVPVAFRWEIKNIGECFGQCDRCNSNIFECEKCCDVCHTLNVRICTTNRTSSACMMSAAQLKSVCYIRCAQKPK